MRSELVVHRLGESDVPALDYFTFFAERVNEVMAKNGLVLDVGCGRSLHPAYVAIRERAAEFWGLDPDPTAAANVALHRFVKGEFPSTTLGPAQFDLIMATYVLEHIHHPAAFFSGVRQALKPGGHFAFVTPNRKHLFCTCVRLVEALGLKKILRRLYGQNRGERWRINDYPALYLANSVRSIASLTQQTGFSRATIWLVPAGWEYYFPRPLRFIAKVYDHLVAPWHPEGNLILVAILSVE